MVNMRVCLLAILYISIVGLFIESVIVFSKWKNRIHGYLFFNCIVQIVNILGYIYELKAESEQMYITALKISYAGRVWIGLSLFFFALELVQKRLPKILSYLLIVYHAIIYLIFVNFQNNSLYYKSYVYETSGLFPKLSHENGILYYIFMSSQVIYLIILIVLFLIALSKKHGIIKKKRLVIVITSLIIQGAFLIVQFTGVIEILHYYDITMIGYFIGTIIMLVAIFTFDLLGTKEIAKEVVADRIAEGIIAIDKDGIVRYYNEEAKSLYPEIENGSAFDVTPIKEAITDKKNLSFDERIFSPEESDLIYDGKDYGKLYAFVDETERLKYMEELRIQKEIADSANESKSRFLANMSHEIRTPINAVLGMDEMILRESDDKTIRSYAADIKSAGRTLLSLINDILDFSKVEEGKMEIIPVQYDLSSMINDLSNMIRERVNKKGLEFKLEVDEHIPHILFGDEIRLKQCVLNLLTNAVKYTEKGTVTMKVSFSKKDSDNIELSFEVSDTGIGMKKEDLEKLFVAYERIEEKRNRMIEGTGLGMNITRELLNLMGSNLEVSSEYGKGSVFSFTVLQSVINWEEIGDYSLKTDYSGEEAYLYTALFTAPDAKVLVVDDTEMNITVIKGLLKETKIKVDDASSGREAIALSDKNEYDAIFIDHMMPDMDGIETLANIRKEGRNTHTYAVALTANAVSGSREMYIGAGFDDYLSKPVDGEKLEKLLFLVLPKEKLKKADEESIKNHDEERVEIPKLLSEIEELDEKAGLKNCGALEEYMSVLSVFCKTGKYKADEIEEYYKNKDIKNFTIKVHALKSSARIIGAAKLSELALNLENAGKEDNISFIDENINILLNMYINLYNRLEVLFVSDEKLQDIDPADLKDAYSAIKETAENMDYDMTEDVLKNLREYNLPIEDEKRINDIERMLNELDWDGIISKVDERD